MDIQAKFVQFLKEDTRDNGQAYGRALVGAPPGVPSVDDVVMGDPFTLTPENIARLNGYLQAASASPVINPYFLINRIQTKLMQIGLQFDMPKMLGMNGSVTKQVKQFGGTYGYPKLYGDRKPAETHSVGFPDISSGDGIQDRIPGGVDINFTWTCFKGMYTIDVQLKAGKPAPEKISEEEIKEGGLEEKHIGFDKLKKKLSHEKGITNPGGLAAVIGAKKYGKKKMQHAAASGHALHENEENPHKILHSHGWKMNPNSGGASPAAYTHKNHPGHTIHIDSRGGWGHYAGNKAVKPAGQKSFERDLKTHLQNFHTQKEEVVNEALPKTMSTNPKQVVLGSPSAARKDVKKHRSIKNPAAMAWYLKHHGSHYSGR
jgi:hypothetical protein